MDKKDPMKKSDSDPGTNFGLKLDQYVENNGVEGCCRNAVTGN
jgi:hypothetical protein